MDSKKDILIQLLSKEKWSSSERLWLLDYLEGNSEHTEELKHLMQKQFEADIEGAESPSFDDSKRVLDKIHSKIEKKKPVSNGLVVTLRWQKFTAAAVFIGGLFFSIYHFSNRDIANVDQVKQTGYASTKDILPGGDKAILTKGDGSKTVLKDGKITYNPSGTKEKKNQYNMITTPRSGSYQVQLPDGTNVWLNAASSIRFPTDFTGNERRVEIQGEAFFSVTKNAKKPFIVSVNDAEIKVLGTEFNVMAYQDEKALKTTLVEGSVVFSNHGGKEVVLKPGQQSLLTKMGDIEVLDHVNIDNVVAWKNGFFDFNGDNIESVTRQLARWYDVEIVMDKSSNDLFYAKIPKNTMLLDVLKALELTGKVRFEVQDRKINVIN
ncbi:FecR family protein [Pedobacter sp. B4-66]|uniref:FecR family protein n=1 Tax=Pedobacter sp. B4-66 TaxID=2817280 RepID=UPI001BDA9D56|nr:FecR family protein [Pedobacter sp. B4-66]